MVQSAAMRFLKKIRESEGLTAYGMAKKLGLIEQTYRHYEQKAEGIKLETLADLRVKLKLTWNDLGDMIDEEVRQNKKNRVKKG